MPSRPEHAALALDAAERLSVADVILAAARVGHAAYEVQCNIAAALGKPAPGRPAPIVDAHAVVAVEQQRDRERQLRQQTEKIARTYDEVITEITKLEKPTKAAIAKIVAAKLDSREGN